jgi:hypothetical protein
MSNFSTHLNRNGVPERPEVPPEQQVTADAGAESEATDAESLRAENAELRRLLEEIERAWGKRQCEYEELLEEKSEVIRDLHLKIQDLPQSESAPTSAPDQAVLVKLQRELEERRLQLEQDEEALMVQMREMEMAMSRDRAELARQRTELQRFQADLNRELEMATRDGGLRDRLQALQRRHQDPHPTSSDPSPQQTPSPKKSNSGLLRRLFGQS